MSIVQQIRQKGPIIHCITNMVAANDMANILLSVGAKPIMARHPKETRTVTQNCSALLMNLGTPDSSTLRAMVRSAATAARSGIPVVLDPVGIGSSKLRQKIARKILKTVRPAVIKGNKSEILALSGKKGSFAGVDAGVESFDETLAKQLAQDFGCIVVVTDKTDIVTDGITTLHIQNGHPLMSIITGSGCMLGALLAAAMSCSNSVQAVGEMVDLYGSAGRSAALRMGPLDGNGSYRTYLLDSMFHTK